MPPKPKKRASTPQRNVKTRQSTKNTTRQRSKSPSVQGLVLQAEETTKGLTDTTAEEAADLTRCQTQITLDDRVDELVKSIDSLPQILHPYGQPGMSEGEIASITKEKKKNNSFVSKETAEMLNTFQTPEDEAQEAENEKVCPECIFMGGKKTRKKRKRRRKTRRRTKRRVKKHRKRKTRRKR